MTSTPTPRWTRSLTGIATAAALLLSACGGSDDASESDAAVVETSDVETSDVEQPAADAEPVALVETAPVDITGEPLPGFDDPANDPAVGMAAPVVSGVSFDGTPLSIGGPSANPTLVTFVAHWCPHCNDEIDEILELVDEGRIPEGLDIVSVSTAVVEDRDNFPPSQWIVDKNWDFPTLVDSQDAAALVAYGGNAFPFAVVIDTDGTVLARSAGQSSGDDIVSFLESALASAAG